MTALSFTTPTPETLYVLIAQAEQYTLMNLQEGAQYSITINASLSHGVIAEEATTATTMTAGI